MKLSIRGKLLGSSLVIIALCAIGSLLAIGHLGDVRQSGKDLHDKAYTPTTSSIYIMALSKDMQLQHMTYRRIVAELGPVDASKSKEFTALLAKTTADQKAVAKTVKALDAAPAGEQQLVAGVKTAIKNYNAALPAAGSKDALKLSAAGQAAVIAKIPAAAEKLEAAAGAFTAASDKFAQTSEDRIDDAYTSGRDVVALSLLLAILAGIAISFFVASRMAKRIGIVVDRLGMLRDNCATELRDGLNRFAGGDLTQDVVPSTPQLEDLGTDEIGDLGRVAEALRCNTVKSVESYNESRAALTGMIGRVSASAATLSGASEPLAGRSRDAGRAVAEIASAIDDVASGSERQVPAGGGAR